MTRVTRLTARAALLAVVLTAGLVHSVGFAQNTAAQIDALARRYNDLRLFNGSVLVAEAGEVIYQNGFGYANMEWKIPNRPDTKFRIGSVTKQFTAALILKLVEDGEITLDAKIADYLPDYPKPAGDEISIHHLLTHSSGIPNYTSLPNFAETIRDPYEPLEFLSVFSDLTLDFEPGTQWSYSNSGYFLLGVIIEVVTETPYDEALRERVLEPLGLLDSGYDHFSDVLEDRAAGYTTTFNGYENAAYISTSLPYAAGSLYSTVEDLYKWDRVLDSDQLFDDPKTKAVMFTPHIQNYGYGLMIHKMPIGADGDSVNVIEHGGGINGFRTGFRRLVDDGHLIVLMDNTSSSVAGLQQGITNILYGLPAEEPKQSIAQVLHETIDVEGVEAGIQQFRDLKENYPESYDFRERELNRLGYDALRNGEIATAIAVFALNVEVYPDASNTYDSLGEAYMEAGERELAIENFRKSLELNPGNDNAKQMLGELGVEVDQGLGEDMPIEPEILQTYVGVYQLQPGFTMTVTLEDGHMMVQATGQAKFEIFAMSETRFFLKVVDAQIEFNRDDAGIVESLTLFQGGQEMPGTKIE